MKSLLLSLCLVGCTSMPAGVTMTDEERAACARDGCSVWTESELQGLVRAAAQKGYDYAKQSRGNSI